MRAGAPYRACGLKIRYRGIVGSGFRPGSPPEHPPRRTPKWMRAPPAGAEGSAAEVLGTRPGFWLGMSSLKFGRPGCRPSGRPPPAPSSSFCHALKGAVSKRSQTSPSSRGWRGQAASTLIGFYKFAEDPAE